MLFWLLTLTVFANLHIGVKSTALPIAIRGYIYTPGIDYHKINSQATTWDRVRSICKEEGGDLAILNTDHDLEIISHLVEVTHPHIGSDDSNHATTGLHDRSIEGQFVTIEAETLALARFNEWLQSDTNDEEGTEDCRSVYKNGQVMDISCYRTYAFVCERPEYKEETSQLNMIVGKGPFARGDDISIACNADGYPTPTVLWYKDDNRIQSNNRTKVSAFRLIISAAEKNDAGKYHCEVANEYTSSAKTVDIKVAEPESITLDRLWLDRQSTDAKRERRNTATHTSYGPGGSAFAHASSEDGGQVYAHTSMDKGQTFSHAYSNDGGRTSVHTFSGGSSSGGRSSSSIIYYITQYLLLKTFCAIIACYF